MVSGNRMTIGPWSLTPRNFRYGESGYMEVLTIKNFDFGVVKNSDRLTAKNLKLWPTPRRRSNSRGRPTPTPPPPHQLCSGDRL